MSALLPTFFLPLQTSSWTLFKISSSLIADGFNNLSDILGNVALLIGLHLASQPADADHRFGHWKIEDLSSLVTSFIMFVVGFQVLIQTVRKIFAKRGNSG